MENNSGASRTEEQANSRRHWRAAAVALTVTLAAIVLAVAARAA